MQGAKRKHPLPPAFGKAGPSAFFDPTVQRILTRWGDTHEGDTHEILRPEGLTAAEAAYHRDRLIAFPLLAFDACDCLASSTRPERCDDWPCLFAQDREFVAELLLAVTKFYARRADRKNLTLAELVEEFEAVGVPERRHPGSLRWMFRLPTWEEVAKAIDRRQIDAERVRKKESDVIRKRRAEILERWKPALAVYWRTVRTDYPFPSPSHPPTK